jgi:acyl carrier protein
MSDKEILKDIADVISYTFPDASFNNDEDLLNISINSTPGWDSMGHFRLVMELENRFDINLSPDDIFEIKDVFSIVSLVKNALK